MIEMVKAFPELYAFPSTEYNSCGRSLLFRQIAIELRKFCTCQTDEHITTHSIQQRWRSLSSHFRRDNLMHKRCGIPYGKWQHFEELMFLQPYINRKIDSKLDTPATSKGTDSATVDTPYETMEMDELSSLDSFFASMSEQAKRLSQEQQLQLQIRCLEAFCEIEASDKPTQV